MLELISSLEFWKYVSIPFVAAVVGWGTNWVAIKLTFKPLEFIGIPPWLGWQGIIPAKAEKMAETFAETTMFRLGTLPELFELMDPETIADQITEVSGRNLNRWTDEVIFWMGQDAVWRRLPRPMRQRVYDRMHAHLPELVDGLMDEIGSRVDDVIDFTDMLVSQLTADRALLNRLFTDAGDVEFRFIIRSGFTLGFLFGLIQLGVWIFYQGWWVLPVFGLIVGWATNWIALNIIFRPLNPHKIGPWTIQGLFLKRQDKVAEVWCHLVTRTIVTVRRIIHAMMNGPKAETTKEIIRRHMRPLVDQAVDGLGIFDTAAEMSLGDEGLDKLREGVGDKALEVSGVPFDDWAFNEERAQIVEEFLRERMQALPSSEFQDLLRPCFQEDEWKLVLMGAVLGFLAGLGQLLFVFGI